MFVSVSWRGTGGLDSAALILLLLCWLKSFLAPCVVASGDESKMATEVSGMVVVGL